MLGKSGSQDLSIEICKGNCSMMVEMAEMVETVEETEVEEVVECRSPTDAQNRLHKSKFLARSLLEKNTLARRWSDRIAPELAFVFSKKIKIVSIVNNKNDNGKEKKKQDDIEKYVSSFQG
eukprot:m.187034 g.187034  ORF g.187034 m.187034 type:complete len:121 (-) comp25610_c0_seq1:106-468(-)